MLQAMRSFLGENDMMAYLSMMAVRMLELHRVLKPTGSLYLHCDNEVVWKRTFAHGSAHKWGPVHDTMLFYSRIDVTHLAIGLIEKRLRDAYRERPDDLNFKTYGVPQDIEGARNLARRGRREGRHYFEFEKWAVSLLAGEQTKNTGDDGIDGIIPFGKKSMAVVSVKAGDNVGVAMIRDLRGAMERTGAEIGIFLTLTPPKGGMAAEAAAAGQHEEPGFAPVPRIQIVTIETAMELRDRAAQIPARLGSVQKVAPKQKNNADQGKLL